MENIFILIEGPDNVGKTTLINGLKTHFSNITFHTLHYSNVKQESIKQHIKYSRKLYTEMFDIITHFSKGNNSGVICDRSHLGELVYGPIFREYSGDYVLDIEKNFCNNNSYNFQKLFLVVLIDDPSNLVQRDDGQSFSIDIDTKKKEIDNFILAYEKSNIKNKILLNVKSYNVEKLLEKVTDFIEANT